MPREPLTCSHEWRDAATWRQLVDNYLVAPYIEAGNPRAMQPGHTYYCWKCEQTLRIPTQTTDDGRRSHDHP